ncbi:MAG: M20/M25/M40 family metallo-hydrolase, partial [Bacillota bacterium]|nr:M20/M25/M40 family metallo-hydrolase [Bacillota bacterium]
MMNERQQRLAELVDENRRMILDTERFIWAHPETGYREWQTEAYLEAIFTSLGYEVVKAGDIPGFYADLDTGRPGPKLLIMGEMDALACPTHPEAVNGNAHACGHNAQCAAMAGLAAALKAPAALEGLSGSIRLMIVPAEELIEIEYRETLRQ